MHPSSTEAEAQYAHAMHLEEKGEEVDSEDGSSDEGAEDKLAKPDYVVVCVFLGSFFFYTFNFAIVERLIKTLFKP